MTNDGLFDVTDIKNDVIKKKRIIRVIHAVWMRSTHMECGHMDTAYMTMNDVVVYSGT